MKKILALICIAVMLITSVGVTAFAENGETQTGATIYTDSHFWAKSGASKNIVNVNNERAYFQHELPTIPDGAVVTSAQWHIRSGTAYQTGADNGTFTFRRFNPKSKLEGFQTDDTGYSEMTTETPFVISDTVTNIKTGDVTVNGISTKFLVVDMTDEVKKAYENNEQYFGYTLTLSQGYCSVSCDDTQGRKPFIEITYSVPASVEIKGLTDGKFVVHSNEEFDILTKITKGEAEISAVDLSVEDANGTKYTDFSEPEISGENYIWSFPGTMPSGSYTVTVTVTDENNLSASHSVKIRVLGEETFDTTVVAEPVKTAVTYNGKWLNSSGGLKANSTSIIAYFEYDLSENKIYNIKNVIWGCKGNSFKGKAELYAITSSWDEDSVKNGYAPVLSAEPIAEANGIESFDITEYVTEQAKKGLGSIGLALKTSNGTVELTAKDMFLSIEKSDNKRPVISAETNMCFAANESIDVFVEDDDFVTSVTAKLDNTECTVSQNIDNQEKWTVKLPAEITKGIHRLEIKAVDYSKAETIVEYAVNISEWFGEHTLVPEDISATATVTDAASGIVLIAAAYRNGILVDVSVESDIVNGNITASVEGNEGDLYKSFVCVEADGVLQLISAL